LDVHYSRQPILKFSELGLSPSNKKYGGTIITFFLSSSASSLPNETPSILAALAKITSMKSLLPLIHKKENHFSSRTLFWSQSMQHRAFILTTSFHQLFCQRRSITPFLPHSIRQMSTTAIAASTTANSKSSQTSSEQVQHKPNNKQMKVNIYRNFQNGKCAEAFDFYKNVFGGEFTWKAEWSLAPEGTLANVDQDGTKIMHIGLALTDGVELMGVDDVPIRDGQSVHLPPSSLLPGTNGKDNDKDDKHHHPDTTDSKRIHRMISPSSVTNNVYISISPESKERADQLLAALSSDGGVVEMPMGDQFWGSYFGMCMDRFGTQWMLDYAPPTTTTAAEVAADTNVLMEE
jgi:PhnB protein